MSQQAIAEQQPPSDAAPAAPDRFARVGGPDVVFGEASGILHAIHRPQVRMAVWQRALPDSIHQAMASFTALMPLHWLFALRAQAPAAPALAQALRGFGPAMAPAFAPWRDDLLGLLALARALVPGADLHVRIETKASNDRAVFHADAVALRMLCTYRGLGTQWRRGEACDHRAPPRDAGADGSGASVEQLPTGAVAVMKGRAYPGQPDRALIHRSPPTPPTCPRVVCVIDIAFP